jgi:hypothetical protein
VLLPLSHSGGNSGAARSSNRLKPTRPVALIYVIEAARLRRKR